MTAVRVLRPDAALDKRGVRRFMPGVCCVYSSIFDLDRKVSDFWMPLGRLWMLRWLLVAKGLQLGYNMLHVDNDVMITTDIYRCACAVANRLDQRALPARHAAWYDEPCAQRSRVRARFTPHQKLQIGASLRRYLKHPHFMQHNLIALATPNLIGINCGVVYSHNAHPAGPTAWAAYQVPDRTLRWLENQPYILEVVNATGRPHKLQDMGFEQSVYNDAVWSVVSGKPFFAHSLRPDWDPSQMAAWEKYHRSIGPDTLKTREVRRSAPSLRVW
jgi:hypothetical protein